MRRFIICILALSWLFSGVVQAESAAALLRAAKRGDVASMRKLGRRLVQGEEGRRNVRNGIRWLEMASSRGDAASMVMLGDLYRKGDSVAQNTNRAISFYERAAGTGNKIAKKRLAAYAPEKLQPEQTRKEESRSADEAPAEATEPVPRGEAAEPAPSQLPVVQEPVITAPREDEVLGGFADKIAAMALSRNVRSISVVSFQSNGGQCDALTARVRSQLLEKLINSYADKLALYDREDCTAVATESGLSMNGEQLTSSQAVLVGEVFSSPGDSIGYVSYRLFRATDTSMVDAGFHAVTWDEAERELLNGSVVTPRRGSLPCIKDAELEKLVAACKHLNTTGVAMGQSGAHSSENTLPKRMAYAQIMPVLLKSGLPLFEREFFLLAARETSLSNQLAMPGHAKAIGQLESMHGSRGTNSFKLKISTIPDGRLLRTVNFTQFAGAGSSVSRVAATRSRHVYNGANDFSKFMDKLDAEYRNVKLVYECEVTISDDYTIPEQYHWKEDDRSKSLWNMGETRVSFDRFTNFESVVPARTCLMNKAREWYKSHNGDSESVRKLLTFSALWGLRSDFNNSEYYLGPFFLNFIEIDKNILIAGSHGSAPDFVSDDLGAIKERLNACIGKSQMSGRIEWSNGALNYQTSIEWKDGLPWKVKARIDLTPMKNKLLKIR